jgi:ankyrin repeat protein
MLHFVSPLVMSGDEEMRVTPLHYLADLADPVDYSTHEKQLILAKQLVEHGANVKAESIPGGETPLHKACYSGNVINLDFVELLLEEGANPNAQEHLGITPLHWSAPGAAKFLLNWPTTDANITTRSGASFLAKVRETVEKLSDRAARPDNPGRVQVQFLLQQWREIKGMLVERGAADTGITTFE